MKPHYPTTIHNNAGTLSTGEPAPRLLAVCHSRWNGDSTQSDREQTLANAQRLAACWNACHGLDLPPDIPAGAVADLVAAARAAMEAYDLRGYGIGEEAQELEDALAPFARQNPAPVSPPLKTTEDIRRDFPGTSFVIVGRPGAYQCRVLRDGDVIATGWGSTVENAEDTAWHGVKITLEDALAPFAGRNPAPVSPDDRRPVWSFEVDGQHVRWCGTLEQFHKDRLAYVAASQGEWETHGPNSWRLHDRTTGTRTTFRAVKA